MRGVSKRQWRVESIIRSFFRVDTGLPRRFIEVVWSRSRAKAFGICSEECSYCIMLMFLSLPVLCLHFPLPSFGRAESLAFILMLQWVSFANFPVLVFAACRLWEGRRLEGLSSFGHDLAQSLSEQDKALLLAARNHPCLHP